MDFIPIVAVLRYAQLVLQKKKCIDPFAVVLLFSIAMCTIAVCLFNQVSWQYCTDIQVLLHLRLLKSFGSRGSRGV